METVLVIIGIAILAGFGFLIMKIQTIAAPRQEDATLKLLNENFNARMQDIATQFHRQSQVLQQSSQSMNERLDNAAKVVGGVTDRMGKMETGFVQQLTQLQEDNKRIFDVGKDISGLHDILRAPKLRGSMGEFFLHDILSQYFPKEKFSMQYAFRTGEIVDAALHLADNRIVPIDSKFPLENFQKMIAIAADEKEYKNLKKVFVNDVKKHIDKIAHYILPDEGTMDFALMYIPAENVYYEIIAKDEADDGLSSYAFKKRVIPVSPNNFFVYLQTILMGLRGLEIEKSAHLIQASLIRLKGDFIKFASEYDVLGKHITNASNKFEESKRSVDKIGNKLETIELSSAEEKVPATLLPEL
ncbi:DNA recombination protein RmuC [Candidatus Gracilibacteria bacterium]|nr:DNA recombination protein RmuC [Candidatus Gracilibacteria bacterium]